jgi:hypothetical protein
MRAGRERYRWPLVSRSEPHAPAAAPSPLIGAAGRSVLWLLAFAPALACAVLVAHHAVDVPLAGDWARADLLEPGQGASGSLDLGGAIPRLVALANLHVFGNDLRLEMALAWLLVLATALCVHGLLRRTHGSGGTLYGITFLANLLLFSPLQWENLLWADRALFFLPTAALCAGLLAFGSRRRSSPGFVAWALLAVGVLGLWLAVGGVDGAAWTARGGSLEVLRFCAAMLGSGFSRTTLVAPGLLAPGLGVTLVVLFVAVAVWPPACRRDDGFRQRRLPWLVLGGYALLLALAAAPGRGAGGPGAPLLPRYTSVSLYLCLASLPLALLALEELRGRTAAARPRLHAALEWAPAFGAGVLLVGVGLGWLVGLQGMAEWKSARLQARTSLVFLDRFEPRHPERLGASPQELRRAVGILDAHGYLVAYRARGPGTEPYAVGEPLPVDAGLVDSAWLDGGRVVLDGFAWLPRPGRRADGVLFTAREGDGSRRVIALAELTGLLLPPIPEHDHIYNDARIPGIDELAAWNAEIPAASLPRAPHGVVEAFAVDSEAMRLHRLSGSVVLRSTQDGLRAELRRDGAP